LFTSLKNVEEVYVDHKIEARAKICIKRNNLLQNKKKLNF
jgi:hypothetical protein